MKSFLLIARVQLFASNRHATIFSISNNSNYRYCLSLSVARHFSFASYSGYCVLPALSSSRVSPFHCKQFQQQLYYLLSVSHPANLSILLLTAPATGVLPDISCSQSHVSFANNSSSMCIARTLSPLRVSLFLARYADYCALPPISCSPSHHSLPLKTTPAISTRGQP